MNSTQLLRIIAIVFVAFQLCCMYLFPTSWMWSSRESHGAVTTVSTASLSIPAAWSVIGLLLFAVLMMSQQSVSVVGVPAWRRRAAAFLLDFHFGLLTLVGTSAIFVQAIRRWEVGHVVSSGESTDPTTSVLLRAILLAILSLAALFLYFVFPLTMGKQTVGCFIMGTKCAPPFGTQGRFTWPVAIRRTWYELKGVCSSPRRDPDGNTWYDLESNCRVVQVEYKSVP
jgi:hypothetical protein